MFFVTSLCVKLSPSARIVYNRLKAERDKEGNLTDGFGNEYSLAEDISKSLYPMFIQTIAELADDGFDVADSVLTFLALMGYGVNTYGKKEKNWMNRDRNIPPEEMDGMILSSDITDAKNFLRENRELKTDQEEVEIPEDLDF